MLEDSMDCLSERQFGGIPRSSSVLAILEMLHTWFVALEKSKSVIRIVFLDFSKAFDLIDHNILLNDFKYVGVRPALLPWLASYLSDRLQRVHIDGSTSCFKKINAGVPQGSKIGPIVFITKIINYQIWHSLTKIQEKNMFQFLWTILPYQRFPI
jgi:hypothetical protein